MAASFAGLSTGLLVSGDSLAAPRPAYSALTSERAWIMPTLESGLQRYLRDCEPQWQAGTDAAEPEPLAA